MSRRPLLKTRKASSRWLSFQCPLTGPFIPTTATSPCGQVWRDCRRSGGNGWRDRRCTSARWWSPPVAAPAESARCQGGPHRRTSRGDSGRSCRADKCQPEVPPARDPRGKRERRPWPRRSNGDAGSSLGAGGDCRTPCTSAAGGRSASQWLDGADRLRLAAPDPHPVGTVGRPVVLDQGLAGLVVQLLQSWSRDAEGKTLGLSLQVAEALVEDAEHNLSHAGVSLSFRLHPWADAVAVGVPPDTGNRPRTHPVGGRQRHRSGSQTMETKAIPWQRIISPTARNPRASSIGTAWRPALTVKDRWAGGAGSVWIAWRQRARPIL